MKFSNNLQELPGRLLEPEQIGARCQTKYQSSIRLGRALNKWTCLSVVELKKWVVICPTNLKKETGRLSGGLMKISRESA